VSITRPLLSIDRDGNSTSLTRSHSSLSLSVRIACCIIMCMRHRSAILSTQTHAHKTAGTYTTIFLQRHPVGRLSARKKNKSQSSSAFIAPRSCFFLCLWSSVGASACSQHRPDCCWDYLVVNIHTARVERRSELGLFSSFCLFLGSTAVALQAERFLLTSSQLDPQTACVRE
jgi:hypothetical protein